MQAALSGFSSGLTARTLRGCDLHGDLLAYADVEFVRLARAPLEFESEYLRSLETPDMHLKPPPPAIMSLIACVWLLSALLASKLLTVTFLVVDVEASTTGTTSSFAGVPPSAVSSEIFLFAIGCPSNN